MKTQQSRDNDDRVARPRTAINFEQIALFPFGKSQQVVRDHELQRLAGRQLKAAAELNESAVLGWQPFEHQLIGSVEERAVAAADR